jgi:hypothetical protein
LPKSNVVLSTWIIAPDVGAAEAAGVAAGGTGAGGGVSDARQTLAAVTVETIKAAQMRMDFILRVYLLLGYQRKPSIGKSQGGTRVDSPLERTKQERL